MNWVVSAAVRSSTCSGTLFSLRVGASLVGFSAAGTGRHQFEKQQADLVVTNSGGRLFELSLDSLRQRNRVLELSGAPQPGDRWTVSLDGDTDYTWGYSVVGSGETLATIATALVNAAATVNDGQERVVAPGTNADPNAKVTVQSAANTTTVTFTNHTFQDDKIVGAYIVFLDDPVSRHEILTRNAGGSELTIGSPDIADITVATGAWRIATRLATDDYDITAPAISGSAYQLKLASDEILGDASGLLDGQRMLYGTGDGTSPYGLTADTIYTVRLSDTAVDRFWLEEDGERVDLSDVDGAGQPINTGLIDLPGSFQSIGLLVGIKLSTVKFDASLEGVSAAEVVSVDATTQADQRWTLEILNKDDEVIASSEYVTAAGNTGQDIVDTLIEGTANRRGGPQRRCVLHPG